MVGLKDHVIETWGSENQNEFIVRDYVPVVNKSLKNAEDVFQIHKCCRAIRKAAIQKTLAKSICKEI